MTILVGRAGVLYADTLVSAVEKNGDARDFTHAVKIKVLSSHKVTYQDGDVLDPVIGYGISGTVSDALSVMDILLNMSAEQNNLILKQGIVKLAGGLDVIGPEFDFTVICLTQSGKFFKVIPVSKGIRLTGLMDYAVAGTSLAFESFLNVLGIKDLSGADDTLFITALKAFIGGGKVPGVGGSLSYLRSSDPVTRVFTVGISIKPEERELIVNKLKTELYEQFGVSDAEPVKVPKAPTKKPKSSKKSKVK